MTHKRSSEIWVTLVLCCLHHRNLLSTWLSCGTWLSGKPSLVQRYFLSLSPFKRYWRKNPSSSEIELPLSTINGSWWWTKSFLEYERWRCMPTVEFQRRRPRYSQVKKKKVGRKEHLRNIRQRRQGNRQGTEVWKGCLVTLHLLATKYELCPVVRFIVSERMIRNITSNTVDLVLPHCKHQEES